MGGLEGGWVGGWVDGGLMIRQIGSLTCLQLVCLKEPEKRASKSLFQGDDWLFGGADDNDPTVDLFGPKKPPKVHQGIFMTPNWGGLKAG